jgi:uncharacterized protein YukE
MPDGSPPNPQPNPNDPWLEGLTFEQIAQLVTEINPDVFYQRAAAFEQAGTRFQDVLDLVRHEMNFVREAWTGKASEDFDAVVRELTGKIGNVLQFLHSPGYGAILRDAGDRLADHQQRFRDLQGQKAAQEATPPAPGAPSPEETAKVNDDSAKQILRDLRTAYWDIGNALAPLPYKPPGVTADTTTTTTTNQGNGNGNGQGNGDGQHGQGNPGTDNFGPTLLGPTALTRKATAHPGDSGGGEPFLFSGQNRNVLGRVDPGGQGLGVPGRPGPVFASNQPQDGTGVLGQAREMVDAQGPFTGSEPGVALPGAVPGVLGRSASRSGACAPAGKGARAAAKETVGKETVGKETVTKETAGKEKGRRERQVLEEVAPETLAAETNGEPAEVTAESAERHRVIKTAADAPAETTEQVHKLVAQVATTSGQPAETHSLVTPKERHEVAAAVTAAGTTVPGTPATPGTPLVPAAHATPAVHGTPAVHATPAAHATPAVHATAAGLRHALETDAPGKPLTFSVGSGGAGGVHQVLDLEPKSRGMFAPGTTTPDGLVGQTTAETISGAAAPAASGRGVTADPYASGHMGMGGMPMGMMMGGMGGLGGNQQNGRMAAMPNEPRPEVWDPSTGAPTAVGRREPEPEEEKPGEKLSQADIQAALAEKFAELDRLTERGK